MKNKELLGGILATISALMGIIGHFMLFLNWYQIGMHTQSAEPGCEILLKYIHPAMADIGILGGILFAVSAYGFFTRRNWAFLLSVIGIVLALLGSWFINVPYMAAGLPPVYFILFWPYLIIYFFLMRAVGNISWGRTLLAMFAGMAYIFCWMNGVASTSRIITIGAPIFVLVERLHWVAMIGWAVVTVGLLTSPKNWLHVLGLVAGATELVVGIPLAFVTAQQLGRFSLFSLAPISCFILIVLFLWPGLWQRVTGLSVNN
jgi:NADH:ubiquinone oxidoreductase subunit K